MSEMSKSTDFYLLTLTFSSEYIHSSESHQCGYTLDQQIAKAITIEPSNFHYIMLEKTMFDELKADNITHSITTDVLKKISSEVKKSSRFPNEVMLELMLTQKNHPGEQQPCII